MPRLSSSLQNHQTLKTSLHKITSRSHIGEGNISVVFKHGDLSVLHGENLELQLQKQAILEEALMHSLYPNAVSY